MDHRSFGRKSFKVDITQARALSHGIGLGQHVKRTIEGPKSAPLADVKMETTAFKSTASARSQPLKRRPVEKTRSQFGLLGVASLVDLVIVFFAFSALFYTLFIFSGLPQGSGVSDAQAFAGWVESNLEVVLGACFFSFAAYFVSSRLVFGNTLGGKLTGSRRSLVDEDGSSHGLNKISR